VDPEQFVECWLNERAYRTKEEWYGDVRYALYASPGDVQTSSIEHPLDVNLRDEITLVGYSLAGEVLEAGEILRLTLFWQARSEVTEDYTVFVHLLDHGGRLVAQRDSEPVGGSRPTTTWIADDIVSDNYGLFIPEDTASVGYRLMVGMYLPATGEGLSVLDAQGQVSGDMVFLGVIQVVEGNRAASEGATWVSQQL
jgi:mannosyltransferase